jgi:hypothetical protein
MGHTLAFDRTHDAPTRSTDIDVAYKPRGAGVVQHVSIRLSDEALYTGGDAIIQVSVEAALERLIPVPVRDDVARVMAMQRHGPLPVEIMGGRFDGKHIDSLPRDRKGWPPPVIVLPDEDTDWTKHYTGTPLDVIGSSAMPTVQFQRGWVAPHTGHWRYTEVAQ